MDLIKMVETKDLLKQIKKIEIKTKRLVDGLVAGNYHSIFKGQGIEFSEIRDYRPGDDVRAIDWKVTARFDRPFVKEFIEERDLRVFFVFDYSASGSFGDVVEKRRTAIELTATLMFSAVRNNDNIGLFIFTDGIERYVPVRKGRKHALKLLSLLLSHKPASTKTDLASALSHVSNIVKKRSILFIVSDFLTDDFEKPLSLLKNRHDVIALNVGDGKEQSLPDVGLIELEDEETGEQMLVDTSDETFQENYRRLLEGHSSKVRSLFKKNKVDEVKFMTGEPYEQSLRRFFSMRKRVV